MRNEFKFMANCLQITSFFVLGESQSVRINDSLAVCKCGRLCVNFHVGIFRMHIRLMAKF